MKKYKIGKRIITADSMIAAVKIAKMLDSPNTRVKPKDSEIDELTQEEQQAVEDYREAIRNTSNPKLLEIYSHILQEETEHLQELAKAKEVDDCCGKMKDSDKDSEIIDLRASYTTADYAGLKDYMKQNGLKAYYIYFDKQSANKAENVARLLQQLNFKTNIVRNNVYEFGQTFDGYVKVTE